MFRRKKDDEGEKGVSLPTDELAIPVKPGSRPTAAAVIPGTSRSTAPVPARPAGEPPRTLGEPPRPVEVARHPKETQSTTPAPQARREADTRKLIVGREISLSGEITSCDRLVVEGSVEANLANCQNIDIAESGLFKGSASIEDAEVRGRFEGTLNVRRRLLIRSTGRVIGTVRYGQVEIECGGQISGDIQSQPPNELVEPASLTRSTVVALTEGMKA